MTEVGASSPIRRVVTHRLQSAEERTRSRGMGAQFRVGAFIILFGVMRVNA
jgi:hypothetical protein